jgi:hypothetical protein
MGDVINLRTARKRRDRAAAAADAAANRAAHGRTRAEKQADKADASRRAAVLDGARLETDPEA